jgi:hypothetical protein
MIRICICSSSPPLVTDIPGNVVGKYTNMPSFRLGVDSVPSLPTGQTLTACPQAQAGQPAFLAHNAPDDGSIDTDQEAIDQVSVFWDNFSQTKRIISAGTSVRERMAAAAIENVLVNASGLNRRHSASHRISRKGCHIPSASATTSDETESRGMVASSGRAHLKLSTTLTLKLTICSHSLR